MRSTFRGSERLSSQESPTVSARASTRPINGATTMNTSVLTQPLERIAVNPAFATAAPA